MFNQTHIESKLSEEIAAQLEKLSQTQDAAERDAILEYVSKLHKLKSEESTTNLAAINTEAKLASDSRIKPPSLDTVLVVGANIFGILWLTRYEKERVIASKALGFVLKAR